MNKYLNRLSTGEFDLDIPKILSNAREINRSVVAGETIKDSITISADGEISGFVESTNRAVVPEENSFAGKDCIIEFQVDASHSKPGESIEGKLIAYTNAGKVEIKYFFDVMRKTIETPAGIIEDINTFADVYDSDPEVAKHLFMSDEFENVVLHSNEMDIALYRELRKQSNINVAIQAILSAKGAREIHREKDDDSVLVCHKSDEEVIRTFSYVWRKKEKEVEQLYLDFRTKVKSFNDFIAESKAILEDGELENLYDNSEEQGRLFIEYQVTRAMLYGLNGEGGMAQSIITSNEELLKAEKERKSPAYFTAIFIYSLIDDSKDVRDTVFNEFNYVLNDIDHTPWQVLYYEYQLDEKRNDNGSMWLARFKDAYSEGCTSPIIYIEAIQILNRQPVLLRMLNSFEIQVLNYAFRYDLLETKLVERFMNVIHEDGRASDEVINFLIRECDRLERKIAAEEADENIVEELKQLRIERWTKLKDAVITALATKLIRAGKVNEKYVSYYEKAIESGHNITLLYEYYLMSHDFNKEVVFPEVVLRYFVFESRIDYHTKAFLYANVLRDRDNIPEIFRDYEVQIKMFAKIQLKEMHIDKNLKYLYEWIWNDSLTTDETTALSAFKLQFMWEIAIDCDNIAYLYIKNKEFTDWKKVPFRDGSAFACVITEGSSFDEEAVYFIEDMLGNRLALNEVGYEIRKGLSIDELNHTAAPCASEPQYLLYRYMQDKLSEDGDGGAAFAKTLLLRGGITEEFEAELHDVIRKNGVGIPEHYNEVAEELNAELELKRKEELFSRLLYAKASYKETEKLFKELTDAGVRGLSIDAYIAYQSFLYFVKNELCDTYVFNFIGNALKQNKDLLMVEKLAFLKYVGTKAVDPLDKEYIPACNRIIDECVMKRYYFNFLSNLQDCLNTPSMLFDKTIIEYHGSTASHVLINDEINMQETIYGIFIYPLVIFAEDKFDYKIVEHTVNGNRRKYMSSIEMHRDEYSDNTSIENAYDLLNDISELQVMEDNEDLEDRLSEYNKREMINNRFFTL